MKFNELLIFYLSEKTLFLEIINTVGLENALKLSNIFGGEKIEIPSREFIKDNIISLIVYLKLLPNPKNSELIDLLAHRFSKSKKEISSMYNKVNNDFKNTVLHTYVTEQFKADSDIGLKDLENFMLDIVG